MEMHFKEATGNDIPLILELMAAFNAIDQYPFDIETRNKNLSEFIGNPKLGRIFIIKETGQVVGYIILTFGYSFEFGGKDAFIDEFFIKEDFRNQGIGKIALDFIENMSGTLGVRAIHLEVENHNKTANSLYLKSGFTGNNRTLLSKRI